MFQSKRLILLALVTQFSLFFVAGLAQAETTHFKKVSILVLENTDYSTAIKDPYLASLASAGALLTNMNGNIHPSQGNYISMIAGDPYGINHDNNVDLTGKNIVDLLEAKNISWAGYFEGYPGNCFTGAQQGRYVRKHNPFISFISISKNASRCSHLKNSTEYFKDLQNNSLPQYSLFVPDLSDDGHDTGLAFASKWLQKTFDSKLKDPNFLKDNLFIITFDESASRSQNHIYTVLLGGNVQANSRFDGNVDHTGLLKLIESEFNLGSLNKKDDSALLINGIWK